MPNTARGASKLALIVVIILIALKIMAGVITGSISLFAQAVDSFLDVFAVITAFFAIGAAAKPADREHPFGHGKVEGIAAATQAVLLFIASAVIVYSAIRRIIIGETLALPIAGIAVMLVSMTTSFFLSRYLRRVAQATGSMAIEANAHNIAADVYTTAGVLVGFVVIYFPNLTIVDPILAIIVAGFIVRAAYGVMRKSFGELVDVKLPENEEFIIKQSVQEHIGELVNFHGLRTRKSGNQRYIDLHIVMPLDITLEEAHRMCDHLEQDITSKLRNANVTIHVEPCTKECEKCPAQPSHPPMKR